MNNEVWLLFKLFGVYIDGVLGVYATREAACADAEKEMTISLSHGWQTWENVSIVFSWRQEGDAYFQEYRHEWDYEGQHHVQESKDSRYCVERFEVEA